MVPETKGKELEDMDQMWLDIDEAKAANKGEEAQS
jgi:hypothetical protein